MVPLQTAFEMGLQKTRGQRDWPGNRVLQHEWRPRHLMRPSRGRESEAGRERGRTAAAPASHTVRAKGASAHGAQATRRTSKGGASAWRVTGHRSSAWSRDAGVDAAVVVLAQCTCATHAQSRKRGLHHHRGWLGRGVGATHILVLSHQLLAARHEARCTSGCGAWGRLAYPNPAPLVPVSHPTTDSKRCRQDRGLAMGFVVRSAWSWSGSASRVHVGRAGIEPASVSPREVCR